MTLAARIALRPSRRLAILETAMPVVGLALAAATLAARWPAATIAIVAATSLATAVWCGLSLRRRSGRRTITVILSNHAEVGVAGSDDTWRVAEPSLVRPGFVVLALRRSAGHGRLVVPLFDGDLAAADRRALHRFLAWCLRGGAASGTS